MNINQLINLKNQISNKNNQLNELKQLYQNIQMDNDNKSSDNQINIQNIFFEDRLVTFLSEDDKIEKVHKEYPVYREACF